MNLLAVLLCLMILCCACCVQCKTCPSATKAHLTRCDLYYKCMVVPSSKTQVWIPSKCDRGLIYEPNLELCVLPADDWECSLGDPSPAKPAEDDQSNVYVRNDLQNLQQKIDTYQPVFYDSEANLPAEELSASASSSASSSSANIEVIEDFAQSRPNTSANDSAEETDDSNDEDEQLEASGDDDNDTDDDQTPLQQKTATYLAVPAPSVSSHLQRLTQLIQSMALAQQQQFETGSTRNHSQELGPNDLNTFLANHDIQSGVRSQLLHVNQRKQQTIASDGRIPAKHMTEILELQQAIQQHSDVEQSGNRPSSAAAASTGSDTTLKLAENGQQIIVNRPGGSVLFQLPVAAQNRPADHQTISDDTLKTMLELSKQLLSSSTAAAAARPSNNQFDTYSYVRPVYYNIPVSHSNYQPSFERPQTYDQSLPTPYDQPADDRSTIIHNHIPITIQNRQKPSSDNDNEQSKVQTTETRYDSFGNKLVTNYQTAAAAPQFLYPPIASKTEEQPSPSTPSSFYYPDSFYPATPHLSDQNVNHHVNVITPAYPTLRPTQAAAANPPPPYRLQSDPVSSYSYPNDIIPNMRQPRPTSAQISDAINSNDNNAAYHQNPQQQPQKRHDSVDPNPPQQQQQPLYYADDDNNGDNDADNYVVDYAENESVHSSVAQPQHQHQHPNQNVMTALPSSSSAAASRPSFVAAANQFGTPPASSSSSTSHHNRIVHYGDTYMPYADYAQSIAPLLSTAGRDRVEVLACVTGARQPSSGDCAKYFVCNASTGKVMTYVCPQYTAFNRESRFCDARTFAECKAATDDGGGGAVMIAERTATVADNRLRVQQQKQQQMLQQQQQEDQQQDQQPIEAEYYDANNEEIPAAPTRQTAPHRPQHFQLLANRPHRRRSTPRPTTTNSLRRVAVPQTRATTSTTTTTTTTPRPPPMRRQKVPSGPIKRLIKCTEPTKVRDSLSVYNYFSCFTGADGELKAVKQTCPNGLVFCAKTKMCTSQDRCKGQKMH